MNMTYEKSPYSPFANVGVTQIDTFWRKRRKLMKLTAKLNIGLISLLAPVGLHAFDSGSTGADGPLDLTEDTELQLPASGIFNYTTITIPAGVTLTFAKNAANTPVTLLASGDVTIEGVIDVSGGDAPITGDANVSDDTMPGIGGPGGFDGGRGGYTIVSGTDSHHGGGGLGPGGGKPGTDVIRSASGCAGGGAGYSSVGGDENHSACPVNVGGPSYGAPRLIPLLGGSGGGGGAGGTRGFGSGGGGGSGALLLASSGTATITGTLRANGGRGRSGGGNGGQGGGGSGGAIRIVATTIAGEGGITAQGSDSTFGDGSKGRIALETENMLRGSDTNPSFAFFVPQPIFVADLPSLAISEVAGIAAPASPTGDGDILLPQDTVNPVEVVFATANVPIGSTITVTATPTNGPSVAATSSPVGGTEADGTATASLDLPNGPSVLFATVEFTVTAALSKDYSKYAQGEPVERVMLRATTGAGAEVTFITASGKAHTWSANAIALGLGGI